MTRPSIVIAEDELIIAEELKRVLLQMGYDIPLVTGSGQQVLEYLQSECPNLILMDIKLKSQINGIEAAERATLQHNIPVVFITANVDAVTIDQVKKIGPYGFIHKPMQPDVLKATVELALSKFNMESAERAASKKLMASFSALEEAVIIVDSQGFVEFMNHKAEQLTAWTAAQAVGQSASDVLNIQNDQASASSAWPLSRVLKDGLEMVFGSGTRLLAKDGTVRMVQGKALPNKSAQSDTDGAVFVFNEIHPSNKQEAATGSTQSLLAQVTSNLPGCYLSVIEKDLTVSYSAGQEFIKQGLNPNQFNGMGLDEIFGAHAPTVREHYLQTFSGSECTFELYINNQYQQYRTVPLTDNDGTIEQILVVVDNITAHKKSEEERQEIDRKLTTLVSNLPGMVYTCLNDDNWTMTIISQGALKLTGYKPEELINNKVATYADLIHPDDRELVSKGVSRAVREQAAFTLEYRIIDRHGRTKWVWEKGRAVISDAREVIALEGFITDISQRKQTEEALHETETLFKLFMKHAPVYTYIKEVNEDSVRVLQASENFKDMIGQTGSEIIGKSMEELFPPEFASKITEDDINVIRQGKVVELDEVLNQRYYKTIKFPLIEGQRKLLAGFTIDVTEQTLVENEIKQSRSNLHTLIENTNDLIWSIDQDYRLLTANTAFLDLIEPIYGERLSPGRQILDRDKLSNELFTKWQTIYDTVLSGRKIINEMESRQPGGNLKIYDFHYTPILNEHGKVIGVSIFGRDITAHKLVENELKQRETQLRALFETIPDYIWVKDKDGVYLSCNPMFERYYGVSESEMIGKTDYDFVDREIADFYREKDKAAMKAGHPVMNEEEIVLAVNSEKILLETVKAPMYDEEGNITAVLGIARDITARKKMESDLAVSEQKYRTLVNNSQQGVFILLTDPMKIMYANPAMCQISGYSWEEWLSVTREQMKQIVHPDDRERLVIHFRKRMHGEKVPEQNEYRILAKDGSVKWISMFSNMIDYMGQPAIMTTFTEITEKKKAETALKESEARFRALHNASFGGIAIHDKGLILECNKGLGDITGFNHDELIGMNGLLLISEDTRQLVINNINAGYEKPYEAVGLRKDGSRYPLRLEARNIPYKERQVRVVEFRDVTTQKESEEALRKSEELFRKLITTVPDIIIGTDISGTITFMNDALFNAFPQLSKTFFLGKNMLFFIADKDKPRAMENTQKMFQKNLGAQEYSFQAEDLILDCEVNGEVIRGAENQPQGMVYVLRDITERKRAVEQIEKSLKEKTVLLKEVHHRVKNNMNVITSLLSLQKTSIHDQEQAMAAFEEARNRIHSMALVHEQLYHTEVFSEMDMHKYIQTLTQRLHHLYSTNKQIIITQEVESVSIDINRAVPLGMLLNEVISNAYKHAFKDRTEGRIHIAFKKQPGKLYKVLVKDDGVGIPPDLTKKDTGSLGLTLIKILTQQLEGNYLFKPLKQGSQFTLKFPAEYN